MDAAKCSAYLNISEWRLKRPLALPERLGRALALDSKPGRLPVVGRLVQENDRQALAASLKAFPVGQTPEAARGPELVFSRFAAKFIPVAEKSREEVRDGGTQHPSRRRRGARATRHTHKRINRDVRWPKPQQPPAQGCSVGTVGRSGWRCFVLGQSRVRFAAVNPHSSCPAFARPAPGPRLSRGALIRARRRAWRMPCSSLSLLTAWSAQSARASAARMSALGKLSMLSRFFAEVGAAAGRAAAGALRALPVACKTTHDAR